MKKCLSFILALVMLLGMMPMTALASENAETGSGTNELAGKTISILGASISTYTGISNNTAYNSTIGNNAVYYTEGRYGIYANDTWWMQVANDLGLRLLVNNSWSGSSLLYERNGTVGAYVDRCVQLHNNDGEEPDIIGIQMGTNDFQYYKDTLGTADIDYAALITENEDGSFTYAAPATSLEAAAIVLHKISIRYPNAEVYYLNISQRIDGTDELIRSFNAELKQVVEHFGAHIVDIYGSAITMADFDTYIGDGRVHPNCLGMDAYTEAFKRALLANTAYEVDTHTVSLDLDGVTADYGDDKIVVSGDAFSCTLTAEDGKELSVSVTMGGEDITDIAYKNGTVSIESVTDDVVITAEATVHQSQNYRWEFDGTDLACVSGSNTLTKNSGTTTDGVFNKTSYTLKNEVVLMHDLPWVVEWKCEGTFLNTNGSSGARIFTSDNVNANYNARYIFKSNTNGIIAMGEKDTNGSHNYGIALADHGIDWTELHTYRLENRIAADGSNMIYLLVDGEEIGPMNHYYIGTKDQNTTSDWLSGKDFVFPYMGTDTHGFTNASIDYIQVNECAHTYENGTCTGCGEELSFDGKTISILGDSISTFSGVSNNTSYNSTIGSNAVYYSGGTLGVYRGDTWWQQIIDALGMELLVNNSWSGSTVFYPRKGESSVGYGDRCVNLHNDTTGEEPDVIVVFLGTNDFSYYQSTLGTADIDYDSLITADGYATPTTTCEAYAIMLHKMIVRYPDAEIYCLGMAARRSPDKEDSYADVGQPTAFNAELKAIVDRFGATYVDLENCGIDADAEIFDLYMGDGRVHPNALGMDKITEALVSAMLGAQTEIVSVSYSLNGVEIDNTTATALEGLGYTASLTPLAGYSNMQVTVTMGGVDVTETAYANGTVNIKTVTGDIVITAQAERAPLSFRWEYENGELVSEENVLTKLAGTTSNEMFTDTRYQLQITALLRHDLPWVLEWKGSGSGGFMLSEASSASSAPFFFRRAGNYLNAFGDHDGSQYNNYGLALSTTDIDGSALHVYRLENHVAVDGTNMVYLYVDGVEIGALNNHYVGGNAQGTTSDWISGKDFKINYIGTPSHPLTNYALEYISVTECVHTYENGICTVCGENAPSESLSLRYDDRYDITGKTVEIVDAGTPTSFKVGYGVAEGTPDDAVVTLEGNYLIATGIGAATVRIDGIIYDITVTAAPISLILLIGQSNMRGSEGNADQSIVCPDGMVYATYGDDRGADNTAMTVNNATMFVPSALTGEYSSINVEGTTDCLSGYPVYSLTEAGAGKIGPDSGFAYEWVKQTGEKVWIVNAAHGGTSIKVWQPGTTEYEQCQALFTACQETLRKEIAAGHFTLSHMGYFWCQGCSDRTQSAAWYVEKYLAMHEGFKDELAFDHDSNPETADKTFEFGGIIPVRVGSTATGYRDGAYTVSNPYAYHESFVDLRFSGPRVAQYWMINNPDLPDIWGVCNIGDDWVWMPDGTNGVTEYFQAHYPGGTVDYTTQVQQSASWYTPTTPNAVHDSVHYNQIGYNEIGRESVRNALIMLGEIEAPDVETTVELLTWDGYTEATQVPSSTTGNSATLVVPVVYPIWKSKDVTYELSEGLSWNYYDLLADTAETEGVLTAIGAEASVNVVKANPGAHFAGHLSQLPENVCCGLNLWSVLEHDEYYYASGTHWGIYSGGEVPSVTILVNPGDHIFATSFGKAGENGNTTSNGIRVTFFSAYGIAKTMTPAECYTEFSANGGYLVAPEGTMAVNIAMWNNSDDNEIYILNLPHDITDDACSVCGKDSHTHNWSDWETVTEPGPDGPGEQKRSCACGETETREILSVWQTTNLAQYIQQLPDNTCCGLNLWAVLNHDSTYYVYSTGDWGNHSSRDVPSITIPVNPGDMIFATSFGPASENGHGSANGIRVTWFDINGVLKTTDPAGTYAEFTANGGYLIAPEGAIAINIPLWGDSEAYEVYILNREHSYESAVTAPTCTEQGYTTHTCTNCGDSYIDGYVPATGHEFGEWIIQTPATCTEEGSRVRVCACGETEYEVIPAIGHNYASVVIAPTCTEAGYTTYTCTLCGESYVDDYVDATGHSYGEWYVVTEATCTAEGQKRHDCANCDHYETEAINATGHSYDSKVTAPTCTEQGYTTYTCRCGDSYVDDYVAATGHSHLETERVEATCTEDGYVLYICHCGDSYTELLPAKGHSYVEGTCEHCGEADPDAVLFGDANGDGTVNHVDAMLAMQYYVGIVNGDAVHVDALDVNGDGIANHVDAMLIMQYYVGIITAFPAEK